MVSPLASESKMHVISHSNAESHSRCEWAHHYGYGYNITPKETADHIQIGKLFHEMAAGYYDALKQGFKYPDAVQAGQIIWQQALLTKKYNLEVCNLVIELYNKYVAYFDFNEWEILWVEEYIEYQVSDNVILNGEIDLVIRDKRRSSPTRGKLGIVDHKTCYNFMTQKELGTHSQIPKYIFAVNMMKIFDEPITFGLINQVRWREVKDVNKLFSRLTLEPSEIKQAAFINEYLKQCREVVKKNELPDPYFWKDLSKRTTIKDICKYCDFNQLCVEELEGGTGKRTMQAYYKKKDYSYRAARERVNGKPITSEEDDS